MDYLIRFVQIHETFRRPEIEALATLTNTTIAFTSYTETSPYATIRLENDSAARTLTARSISSKGIHELWGSGTTYANLHADIRHRSHARGSAYQSSSFRFDFDTFAGSRALGEQKAVIDSFGYLGLGPVRMKDPEEVFTVFEEYGDGEGGGDGDGKVNGNGPVRIFLGRFVGGSQRRVLNEYTLKKREYINTTSMDSELALLTANMALAGEGKVFYDPFVGTGSFPIACSHFGARTLGSDIDGRMVRGREGKDIRTNFRQYGLLGRYLDGFISDITNSPLRGGRWLDGIVGDPPYGVREGLKVLGTKDGSGKEVVYINGEAAHLRDKYFPPKKAYSFEAMLEDLLEFAAEMLVDEGRLSLWMPTANDEDVELGIPAHPCLELMTVCVQTFNKWSRRLLTYRRIADSQIKDGFPMRQKLEVKGSTANELNSFRKRYFEGFKPPLAEQLREEPATED